MILVSFVFSLGHLALFSFLLRLLSPFLRIWRLCVDSLSFRPRVPVPHTLTFGRSSDSRSSLFNIPPCFSKWKGWARRARDGERDWDTRSYPDHYAKPKKPATYFVSDDVSLGGPRAWVPRRCLARERGVDLTVYTAMI